MMKRKLCARMLMIALIAAVPAYGQNKEQGTPAKARVAPGAGEAAIRARVAEWQKAIDARDVEKCAAFYADDAQIFPPGAPVVTGAAQVLDRFPGGRRRQDHARNHPD